MDGKFAYTDGPKRGTLFPSCGPWMENSFIPMDQGGEHSSPPVVHGWKINLYRWTRKGNSIAAAAAFLVSPTYSLLVSPILLYFSAGMSIFEEENDDFK